MPQTIKDAEGKEHVVHTQEEIDAIASQKAHEAQKGKDEQIQAKDEQISKLNSDMEELRKTLSSADQGTKDWALARNQIKTLESQISTLVKEKDQIKDEFGREIRSVRTSVFQSQVDSMVDGLAGDDVEVAKKIRFHYGRLANNVTTEKEAAEVIKDAYLLATGKNSPNPLSVARGGYAGGPPVVRAQTDQDVSELGRKFGVSDEDLKKFSKKAQEKKQPTR